MELTVDSSVEGTKQVYKLKGILDFSTVDSFNFVNDINEFIKEIDIDFSELEFIDSTGIGAILSILHAASNLNLKVNFCGMSDETKDLLETIGVFKIKQSLLGEV